MKKKLLAFTLCSLFSMFGGMLCAYATPVNLNVGYFDPIPSGQAFGAGLGQQL
jgi:hypothetical protein